MAVMKDPSPAFAKTTTVIDLATGKKRMTQQVPSIQITITASEVGEMAQEVGNLPQDFDPATWLEENAADLTIVATEAAKEVVYEALELGFGWCL